MLLLTFLTAIIVVCLGPGSVHTLRHIYSPLLPQVHYRYTHFWLHHTTSIFDIRWYVPCSAHYILANFLPAFSALRVYAIWERNVWLSFIVLVLNLVSFGELLVRSPYFVVKSGRWHYGIIVQYRGRHRGIYWCTWLRMHRQHPGFVSKFRQVSTHSNEFFESLSLFYDRTRKRVSNHQSWSRYVSHMSLKLSVLGEFQLLRQTYLFWSSHGRRPIAISAKPWTSK